jgi:hypothetical protein
MAKVMDAGEIIALCCNNDTPLGFWHRTYSLAHQMVMTAFYQMGEEA